MAGSLPVAHFYRNRQILITGATGFMGKVLLEKLLRSCHDIQKIFIIIRCKKGKPAECRIGEIFKSKMFDNLRENSPQSLSKVIAVEGDLSKPNFAVKPKHLQDITENVSIIFHCAASISFTDSLKQAININLLPVKHLLNMCQRMTNLTAYVHVATAYSHCNPNPNEITKTDEIFYPTNFDPDKIIDLFDGLDDDLADKLSHTITEGYPNTYSITKHLAESLLFKCSGSLPISIVRPSLVSPALKEPLVGWIDNYTHVAGNITAAGCGLTRHVYLMPQDVLDIIPVDIAINLIIAVGAQTATQRQIKIYNCVSSATNPMKGKVVNDYAFQNFHKHTFNTMFRLPYVTLQNQIKLYNLRMTWDYYTVIYPLHLIFQLLGKNARLKNRFLNLWDKTLLSSYYLRNKWQFTDHNVRQLWHQVSTRDKQVFNFDIAQIDWPSYMNNCALGCKQFLMNESLTQIGQAQKLYTRLWFWHKVLITLKLTIIFVLCKKFILKRANIISFFFLLTKLINKFE